MLDLRAEVEHAAVQEVVVVGSRREEEAHPEAAAALAAIVVVAVVSLDLVDSLAVAGPQEDEAVVDTRV